LSSPYDGVVRRALALQPSLYLPAEDGSSLKGAVLGGVAPHHDLALDMIVEFYREIKGSSGAKRDVRRVWLFAPDHFRRAKRWAAVCPSDWTLSEGSISADRGVVRALGGMSIVETDSALFSREHGVTLHIPLIARFFPRASVVPIVLRPDIPDVALLMLRGKIRELMDDGDIIILSMDLSHYKTPEAAEIEDGRALEVLLAMRPLAASSIDADARRAASLVLTLLRDRGARRGELIKRSDSSSILGRRVESGTGYATVIYYSASGAAKP
jgi:AmmeMemoRadiSam system protein B